MDHSRFELELTESMLMQHAAGPATVLQQLEQHAIPVAIDDFGTGFSSLAYLQEIHAHCLKIDRRFIVDIENEAASTRIAASIIAMAQALGLKVIAEGVETEAQLAVLRQLGCDCYQGYLFSPALPITEFTGLLEQA